MLWWSIWLMSIMTVTESFYVFTYHYITERDQHLKCFHTGTAVAWMLS